MSDVLHSLSCLLVHGYALCMGHAMPMASAPSQPAFALALHGIMTLAFVSYEYTSTRTYSYVEYVLYYCTYIMYTIYTRQQRVVVFFWRVIFAQSRALLIILHIYTGGTV